MKTLQQALLLAMAITISVIAAHALLRPPVQTFVLYLICGFSGVAGHKLGAKTK